MPRNYSHHISIALAILMATIACGLPGQTIQPTAGIDPVSIQTVVAGTAQAAAEQTAAAAQPVATSMTGTVLQQSEAGFSKYVDYEAGFEIMFPPGWLAVRPHSEEFDAALAREGRSNSMLREQMELDLAEYSASDRLYVYILRPDLEKNLVLGFAYVDWLLGDSVPIEDVSMDVVLRNFESSSGLQGFHATTAERRQNGQGVNMIEIGGPCTVNNGEGLFIRYYVKAIFFKPTPDSVARITYTFVESYQNEISTDADASIKTILLIKQ